jgi:hypothetical protein
MFYIIFIAEIRSLLFAEETRNIRLLRSCDAQCMLAAQHNQRELVQVSYPRQVRGRKVGAQQMAG